MQIGVGSGNPVKRRAVESVVRSEAVASTFGEVTVETAPVSSGVSEQPFGHDETVTGAENRARNVLDDDAYDFGVGVEGGVAEFDGTDGLYLVMWAAVTDGDHWGRGSGPSIELPTTVAERVRDGEELGPVMDDVLGMENVARKQGAAGAFTGGRIDRETALTTAVAGAFGPFVTEFY